MMKSFELSTADRHVINPLFWQRHDAPEALREEMRRMKETGINDFILEPRPHPDYLGETWWSDFDLILQEAERLDMTVWIFDDGTYPSGTANGELARKYPEHTKRYWVENHMDATGPLPHAHFLIDEWLKPGETLFRIVAARRADRGDALIAETLTDVTDFYARGRLYWPVPEGDWRVFAIKVSPLRRGGAYKGLRQSPEPGRRVEIHRTGARAALCPVREILREPHRGFFSPMNRASATSRATTA